MTTGTFLRREIDDRTHILICLCGMSPAVVTETVYALAQSGDPPAQVIVITTSAGEAVLREKLWDSGVWAALEKRLKMEWRFFAKSETSAAAARWRLQRFRCDLLIHRGECRGFYSGRIAAVYGKSRYPDYLFNRRRAQDLECIRRIVHESARAT